VKKQSRGTHDANSRNSFLKQEGQLYLGKRFKHLAFLGITETFRITDSERRHLRRK